MDTAARCNVSHPYISADEAIAFCNDPTTLQVTIGVTLSAVAFLTFIPQIWKIVERKTTEGLSWHSVFCGAATQVCSCTNIVVTKWPVLLAGFDSHPACLLDIQALYMNSIVLLLSTVIFFLYLIYPSLVVQSDPEEQGTGAKRYDSDEFNRAQLAIPANSASAGGDGSGVGFVSLMVMIVVIVGVAGGFIHTYGCCSVMSLSYGTGLGVTGSIFTCVQMMPQIVTTWRLKSAGSLSIATLAMQTPGSFIFAGFQYFLDHNGLFVVMPFIVLGVQQVVLGSMVIYFMHRSSKPTETFTPLLA